MDPFITAATIADYLKIEDAAVLPQLTPLRAQAIASIQMHVRRPLTIELFDHVVERPYTGKQRLACITLPVFPLASAGDSAGNYSVSSDVEITDGDSNVVADTNYRVDARAGQIIAATDFWFDTFPYTCIFAAGLGARSDYTDVVVPVIDLAIRDTVADAWQKRNPAASMETAGGNIMTQYQQGNFSGIPQRVKDALAPLVMRRVL